MKKTLLLFPYTLLALFVYSQQILLADLKPLEGNWKGSLTYLDYSSGKPFTMPANITIRTFSEKKGIIMQYIYPNEPHANGADTILLTKDFLGDEKIASIKKSNPVAFLLITEKAGVDGNDNKMAQFRHTYRVTNNKLSIRKEVKFAGTEAWIIRNEYVLNK
ncbi:MAG: hypothetical protein WCH59_09995 [Chitinophagia bacterium]|jgi:hypothetical protein